MINKAIINALIITGLLILVSLCIRLDVLYFHNDMGENSVTEMAQLVLLCISIFSFFYLGKRKPELRHAAWLIGSFYLVLFIRENDGLLDNIYHGAWQVPAVIVTLSALIFAKQGGKKTFAEMNIILSARSINIVIMATLMLIVFSRFYGMNELWKTLLQHAFVREVKNVSEESIELLSYAMISYGSIKVCWELSRCKIQNNIKSYLNVIEEN